MSLNIINQYALAIELISLGARTKIVAKETGLSPKIIRQAIEDMHGQSAPSGSLKTSPQFITKSFSMLKEATVYVFFFRIENNLVFCKRSIKAYRRYSSYIQTALKSEPIFDFSDAYVIAKWSDSGTLKLVRCGHCRSAKLINNELQHNVCCVCKS